MPPAGTVDADASPITAANPMRDNHVGLLVVTEGREPPRVVGVSQRKPVTSGDRESRPVFVPSMQ